MKFFIVGKQGSGKHEVLDLLDEMNIRVGREFSNLPAYNEQIYMDPKYEQYSSNDISDIFEQNSYIYIGGIDENCVLDGYSYYRGLSHYTYDNSDVMLLTPKSLETLNRKNIRDHVVFVWMDNTRDNRIHRYVEQGRKYPFMDVEKIESQYDNDFVKNIYGFKNSSILYFTNEDPCRVAAIVAAIVKHPDLKDVFVDNFN